MSTVTLEERGLLVIVEDGAPEEEWHEGRDGGMTASRIHDVAAGSRKTWRRMLDEMLNGSTFKGNAHTQRGHAREGELIAAGELFDGVVILRRSGALFGNHDNPLHRGTPDGLGIHAELGHFIAEAKHHAEGYTQDRIPADHLDQMLWNMHVLDVDWALYIWGVEGEDDIHHEWVPRDDKRIAQLVGQADAFIAWREAGAPEIDDLPDDIDDAIAEYSTAQQAESRAKKAKEAAGEIVRAWLAKQKAKHGDPLRKSGSRASLFFEPKPDTAVLDEEAWAAAEPDGYAEYLEAERRLLETRSAALLLYKTTKPAAPTLRITPNGATK